MSNIHYLSLQRDSETLIRLEKLAQLHDAAERKLLARMERLYRFLAKFFA